MVDTINKVVGKCSRNCSKKNSKSYCLDTFARIIDGQCNSLKKPKEGGQSKLF